MADGFELCCNRDAQTVLCVEPSLIQPNVRSAFRACSTPMETILTEVELLSQHLTLNFVENLNLLMTIRARLGMIARSDAQQSLHAARTRGIEFTDDV